MSVAVEASEYLFSYGTLQDKAVQLANFGRELSGSADALPGYEQAWVEITDPEVLATSGKTHHPILRRGSATSVPIPGTVFRITAAELAAADSYEVADYKRVSVVLQSGIEAWVYVSV
ncbi:gamma-glutamylcyclotransferase family protein [Pseudomonas sp. NPDC089530]|uniref:gamma-glutamylcyclotransferase family protein n=1 Tax=Pseudomonas sp. NPDC089530 TaxID=3390651 RepID=UPI003CFF7A99